MSTPTPTYSFSGHETFPFRYPWMKKGFDAVLMDGGVFQRDDAITTLGVGKNMVRSIRHWCLAASIIEEDREPGGRPSGAVRPSRLGRLVFGDGGFDPYMEDPATLWLLHWQLATNASRATTWYWAFSHFHEPEFTRDSLASALFKWTQTLPGKKVAEGSVRRDVDTFLRTYVPSRQSAGAFTEDTLDCPLIDLGLIRASDGGQSFSFSRGAQENLPDGILLYATLRFWDQAASQAETLSLADLSRLPAGPGQVFKLDESSLVGRFETVEAWTRGRLAYRETAGLRQLYRRGRTDPFETLGAAYGVMASGRGGLFDE